MKTTPSLRRASTRSSLSEGGPPLPAKCIDIAVGGETIIVAELENRYWLETVYTLARNLSYNFRMLSQVTWFCFSVIFKSWYSTQNLNFDSLKSR